MAGALDFPAVTLDTLIDRSLITSLVGWVPGQIAYVDSNTGASTNDGQTRKSAFATIGQALATLTDNKGGVVCVMPGHAETLSTSTTGLAWTQAGATVIGFGNGRSRPAITCGAADIVGILISGANNRMVNIRLIGSASQTTATSFALSVTGTDALFQNCVFEHGAAPLTAVGLNGATRAQFEDCLWLGTAAGPDMGLKIFGSSTHLRVRRCVFNYGTVNVDSAAIGVLASSNCANSIFEDIVILGANSSAIRILGSGAATVPDSLIARVYGGSNTGITIGSAMPFDCGGAQLANCFWTDAVAAASAWIGAALPPVAGTATSKAYTLSPGPT